MASAFENLIPELFDAVLAFLCHSKHFDGDDDYYKQLQDLASLSSTSHALHDKVEPTLYATFHSSMCRRRLRPFLRTLCSKPELARRVRILSLRSPREKPPTMPTSYDMQLFTAALTSAIKDRAMSEMLKAAIATGCQRAECLLLLSLTTQIVHLSFDVNPFEDILRHGYIKSCTDCPNVLDSVKQIIRASEDPSYQNLRKLRVDADPNSHPETETAHIALSTFMALPNLKQLSTKNLVASVEPAGWTAPEHSSEVSCLLMESSFLNTRALKDLILSCKVLSTIEIELDAFSTNTNTLQLGYDVDPPLTRAALMKHSETIQCLTLHNVRNDGVAFRGKPALGSLVEFQRLQALVVDESLLTGTRDWAVVDLNRILPLSLTSLKVHSYGDFDCLGDIMLAMCSFQGSYLQTFQLTFSLSAHEENDRHLLEWPLLESRPPSIPGFSVDYERGLEQIIVRYCFPKMRALAMAYYNEIEEQGLSLILDAAINPEKYRKDAGTIADAEVVEG